MYIFIRDRGGIENWGQAEFSTVGNSCNTATWCGGGSIDEHWGWSVAAQSDVVFVGGPGNGANDPGEVALLRRDPATDLWTFDTMLFALARFNVTVSPQKVTFSAGASPPPSSTIQR